MRPASTALSICHVITTLGVGGAERVVLDLAAAQRGAGHRVSVVALDETDGPMAIEFRRVVDVLERIPKRGRGLDLTLPLRLARWFRARGAQIVHTHNSLPLIYGAPAGKLARAAVVHSKHGEHVSSSRVRWLRRASAIATDAYVAVSAPTAAFARANHECRIRKLRIVINGTDMSRFPASKSDGEAVRRELGIAESARVLITIGRLVWEKNHPLLLRTATPLLGPDRQLVIVGDGPLRDDLDALRDHLPGREYVHVTGGRRDVPALLQAADAFVLSSDTEGLPIGLLEAMAAGLPVVATSVGGIPDVVAHEATGLLVPPRDEAALGAALTRVFEGSEAVTRMAARGREHILATYSAERMADDYFAVYAAVRSK